MKIAFVTDKPYSACETFIKAQLDNLNFEIVHIWKMHDRFESIGLPAPEPLGDKFRRVFLGKVDKEAKIIRFLKKQNVELILAQYGVMGVAFLSICKKMNLPLAVHFHGHDAVRKSILDQYRDSYLDLFKYPKSHIFSVSSVMTQRLESLGCPSDKITHNPYGPDPSFFEIKSSFQRLRFCALGRFVDKKAPVLTILAFHKLWLESPDAHLIFGGNGYLLSVCKDLVQALKIEEAVTFTGHVSREDFQGILADSCAFIQHSITAKDGDMEGTPVAILEASAAGLPIVSTFHAGIPDVVKDEETGYLVAPHDITAMAQALNKIAQDLEQSKNMGEAGRKRIKEKFTQQRYLNTLEEHLNRLADQ